MKRYDFRYTTKPWLVTLFSLLDGVVALLIMYQLFSWGEALMDRVPFMSGAEVGSARSMVVLVITLMMITLYFGIAFGVMRLMERLRTRFIFPRITTELGEGVVVIHSKTKIHTLYFSDISALTVRGNDHNHLNLVVYFDIHHDNGRALRLGATMTPRQAEKQGDGYFAFRDDLLSAHFDFMKQKKRRAQAQ